MKRNFWKKNEIKCMLGVFKDLNVVQLLDQKSVPINDVYKRVEIEMARRGFRMKNGKQIQSKWSQMKSAYMCMKRQHKLDFYKFKDLEFRDDVAELVESGEIDLEFSGGGESISARSMQSTSSEITPDFPELIPADLVEAEESPPAAGVAAVMVTQTELDQPITDDEIDETRDLYQEIELEPDEEIYIPANKPTISLPNDETPIRQGSYKKSFGRFLQQLKELESDLQEEFVAKQMRLMEQEHRLQIKRDNLIIRSLATSTNQILKQTQEMIEKGFSR